MWALIVMRPNRLGEGNGPETNFPEAAIFRLDKMRKHIIMPLHYKLVDY